MTRPRNEINNHRCDNCNHEWESLAKKPEKCPSCKSLKWNDRIHHLCYACGNKWSGFVEHPNRCPACKSRNWEERRIPIYQFGDRVVLPELLPWGEQNYLVYQRANNQGASISGKIDSLIGACRNLDAVKDMTPAIITTNHQIEREDAESSEAGLEP